MIVNIDGRLRLPKIFGDTSAGKARLQRCIDFVKNEVVNTIASGNKTFNAQTLFGGDNCDWVALGFPIGDFWLELEQKYINEGYVDPQYQAERQAGIYVGMVLKYVCHRVLKTHFKMKHDFKHIVYTVV